MEKHKPFITERVKIRTTRLRKQHEKTGYGKEEWSDNNERTASQSIRKATHEMRHPHVNRRSDSSDEAELNRIGFEFYENKRCCQIIYAKAKSIPNGATLMRHSVAYS